MNEGIMYVVALLAPIAVAICGYTIREWREDESQNEFGYFPSYAEDHKQAVKVLGEDYFA